uniref:Uncharacterized protein n=1 Tax=Avena sativa TaxID=4498 RepID=A0ACD5XU40_AVESA
MVLVDFVCLHFVQLDLSCVSSFCSAGGLCYVDCKLHLSGKNHDTYCIILNQVKSYTQKITPLVKVLGQVPRLKRAPKKQRTCDAILCMLGDMNTSFNDALKTTERLHMQQITPPADILAALDKIPDFSQSDKLRAYGKLVLSERLFLALMELPIDFRKEWLLTLN